MSKKGITPENFAIQINTLKGNISSTSIYSAEDVVKLLKKYNLPSCSNYLAGYVGNGILIRIGKNQYKFPASPIYAGTIKKVLAEIRNQHNASRQKPEPVIKEPSEEDTINRCIDYLKQKGFLILKQV